MGTTIHRLRHARLGNGTAEGCMGQGERSAMTRAAAAKVGELFEVLRINYRDDHNTRDTSGRVARMLVEETLRGLYCGIRRKAASDSDGTQPLIPMQASHPFRGQPAAPGRG